jgi:asparagine synthase (glutamine-hydrolysing)
MMWNAESPEAAAVSLDLERKLKATASDWAQVLKGPGFGVWVAERSTCFGAHLLCDDAGVVVGEAFARVKDLQSDAPAYDAKFNRMETLEALRTQGRSLAAKFWGNFVAFIVDRVQGNGGRGARYVFKDPSGTLPCYFTEQQGVQVVFSSLEDCRRIGFSFRVNWEFVRSRAVNSFLDTEIPTLLGVSTVHRGECVAFDDRGKAISQSLYWHPSSFEGASDLVVDSAAAAKFMRATVRSCVHSMAGHHLSVLAQTSGGLDSSIVLGCLGDAPHKPKITCYTAYLKDSVCDERRWARHASQRGGYRHIEVCRGPRDLVFRDLPALAPSVEPASFFPIGSGGLWTEKWPRSIGPPRRSPEKAETLRFARPPTVTLPITA